MTRVPFQEAVTLVKGQLDIVEIISRHLPLKRAGRNYLGLCPFHPDKHPSMNVSREKGLFKCFSCGEGGDALSFLMKIERKTFGEVIRELAEAQGVDIEQDGVAAQEADRRRDLSQRLLTLNQEAQAYFEAQFAEPSGAMARCYCDERGFPKEILQRFGLGFAPPGWENLTRRLLESQSFVRANPDLLVDAGLASPRQADGERPAHAAGGATGGGYYDRFRNRLTIPIHDDAGRIVAFGARALAPEDKPKYLNSPETALYQKSRLLYGLFAARETIRQQRDVILMEGYFDVIRAHQCGLTQAVGVCGTALTEQHVKLLMRWGVERLYLAFDADEAGQKAALAAIATLEGIPAASELTIRVAQIPEGKDPDDFLRARGDQARDAFGDILQAAPAALDFQCLRALHGLNLMEPEGRIKAAARLTPTLAAVSQPVKRQEYVARYAHRIGVRPEDLTLEIRRWLRLHGRETGESASYEGRSARGAFRDKFVDEKGGEKAGKKQFVSTGAISERQRRFHNRTGLTPGAPSLSDGRPLPRHQAAERTLLSLLFLSPESYKMIRPIVETCVFEDNTLQSLAGVLQGASLSGDDVHGESVERVIQAVNEALNGRFQDEPAVLSELENAFTDVVFYADALSEQLGLAALSPSEAAHVARQEAQKCQTALDERQRLQALRALADQTREREQQARQIPDAPQTPLLEALYEFRDQVTRVKSSGYSHQEI
ncbi:MAG: DNA primase [Vampirovibrionales bacterium]|nr:DNA primase [Vampirovibrionales bacterium]